MIKKDKDFAEKYLKRYDTFKEFVLTLKKNSRFKNDILSWVHFVPQYKFIYYNKECLLDYIGYYENLEKSYRIISNKLNINKSLKRYNSSNHKPYYEYYDERTIDIVYNIYKKDIMLFNYNFR